MANSTPPEIGLPRPFLSSIEFLIGLSEKQAGVLVETLRDAPFDRKTTEIVETLGEYDKVFTPREVERIIGFLISTRALTTFLDTDVPGVASAIDRAYRSSRPKSEPGRLADHLTALLDSPLITIREKSDRLSQEYDSVLQRVQVLTDLRPVFGPKEDTDQITGFLISNTLVLEVSSSRDESTTRQFISIPTSSLESVKDAVDRALEKGEALNAFLQGVHQRNLGELGED